MVYSNLFVFNVCAFFFFFFFICFPWHYKNRFLDPSCKPLFYLDICVSLLFILPNWLWFCTRTACWNVSMRHFINLWFSLICLCSMFVPFFFMCFHDSIKVGFLIFHVNLCCIWIYVWVYFSFCLTGYDYAHGLLVEMRQWV